MQSHKHFRTDWQSKGGLSPRGEADSSGVRNIFAGEDARVVGIGGGKDCVSGRWVRVPAESGCEGGGGQIGPDMQGRGREGDVLASGRGDFER